MYLRWSISESYLHCQHWKANQILLPQYISSSYSQSKLAHPLLFKCRISSQKKDYESYTVQAYFEYLPIKASQEVMKCDSVFWHLENKMETHLMLLWLEYQEKKKAIPSRSRTKIDLCIRPLSCCKHDNII